MDGGFRPKYRLIQQLIVNNNSNNNNIIYIPLIRLSAKRLNNKITLMINLIKMVKLKIK